MQLTLRTLSRQACVGLAMLEAIAALLVLAVGAVGVLWWQQQATLRQQQQIYQFIAMGLADDLAERLRINASQSALYALGWGEARQTSLDCFASACSWTQLAHWDIAKCNRHCAHSCPRAMHRFTPCQGQQDGGASASGGPLTK